MKKLLTTIAIVLASLTLALNLASCEGRQKFDFTNVNSIADLNGAVIGAQTGTFHLDALKDQTEGVTVKEYGDFTQLLTALNSGVIDGYVAEEPTAYAVTAQDSNLTYLHLKNNDTGFTATASDTGIAVAFATGSEYVARVNEILAGISEETRAALMQQAVALSSDPDTEAGSPVLVSSNEVLPEAATLKIAMECAYAPFNWSQTTAANGAVKISNSGNSFYANGYDVQIAKYIAAELGMNLEIYAEEWESLITGVQAGTYTGIIAGMSPTAEREEEVDFTECYYNSNLVIIYKK
ncbi:MAG: transporter substrate-binding domain-containing protein [Clostridia bacterium]|nr:transporter substrate-binding domain-containing protein [Clostridia bacterium]